MKRPLVALAMLSAVSVTLAATLMVALPLPMMGAAEGKREEPKSANPNRRAIGHSFPADADPHVTLPTWWKKGDPVPQVKSNCVRCHLTAGRELTAPVQDFARSVHDLQGMTCSDCHGGNREKNASAHEEEFGFIGTKLSAHLANCASCHSEQAEQVKSGPHYWDFSKKINLSYPVCIDCHGHHDVAKPPAEFALKTVCSECHLHFDKQMPAVAAVVAENDRLWDVLRKIELKNSSGDKLIPVQFDRQRSHARELTAKLIHPAHKISAAEAVELNSEVAKIRKELEAWLLKEGTGLSGGKGHAK